MKTLFTFLLYFLLLPTMIFSQNRISETNRNFKEFKSDLLKSERSNGKDTFREKQLYENKIDGKRVINKKLLENGFLLIEAIYQKWDGSAWMNDWKVSYTYDENNNQTEESYQNWNDSSWVNSLKFLYTYDENNNRNEELWQNWDGSAWVNSSKTSYTYDENNNTTELLRQSWNGSAWVNSSKTSYTYDENNNRTEGLWQIWDGSAWVYLPDGPAVSGKDSYTYDENNNRTEVLHQNWNDSAWVNVYKGSYTYDEYNNRTEELWQWWSGSAWVTNDKNTYTYDENNNETEQLDKYWNGSAWVNEYKYSYKYSPVTKINEDLSLINSYSLSNNYPNPFNPSTTIKYSIPKEAYVTLKVYDILGKEVETLVNEEKPTGNYRVEFNAANLSSGVYFYQLKAGSFVESKTMVLMK